jgi:phosphohistidine phosphatase SixA
VAGVRVAPAFAPPTFVLAAALGWAGWCAWAAAPGDAWAEPGGGRGGRGAPGDTTAAAADTARVEVRGLAPADTALIGSLRSGGYVIAFRHAATNWNERDSEVLNYAERSAQRNLSEAGKEDAGNIGKAFVALGIPVGGVQSSPFWRCRDTATLAFGRCDTTSSLFVKSRAHRRVRWDLMSTRPPAGKNTVLVTHQDALIPITTLARDQLKEGDALVVEPLGPGRGFRAVAQVAPADWLRLAAELGIAVPGVRPPPARPDTVSAPK